MGTGSLECSNFQMLPQIKFGTDGWRGIISHNFTYRNTERVIQAAADWFGSNAKCAVGYDTRFLSSRYGRLAAEVLSGNGINVILSKHPVSTPMLSYIIKRKRLSAGIMITASHNPGIYNGIKIKEAFGGSALPDTTKGIEKLIDKSRAKRNGRLIKEEDISRLYINGLKRYLNPVSMRRKQFKIVVDSMYGAGGFYLEKILKAFGHKVVTIHGMPNPIFPGLNPEPIGANLKGLSKAVRHYNADIGIATDGDADRVGIVDNKGSVLTPHYVLALLFMHIKRTRLWEGSVIKTISTTSLINKIAQKYGILVRETPVGFKYIIEWMLKEDVLIGGEESGGNGFKNHIPERDGMLSGLLLVEMMGHRGIGIRQAVRDMESEFGQYRYCRIDQHLKQNDIKKMYRNLKKNSPAQIGGYKVKQIKVFDGIKFIMKDGSWLLLRGSGTEPLLRIYAEAKTAKQVDRLISAGKNLALN